MRHKRVADVMTQDVITVPVDMPFHGIVRTMAEHAVSGVPVIDAHRRVVGIVTEADLIGRQAGVAPVSAWQALRRRLFSQRGTGRTAADLMSAPVVTVDAGARLTTAAALMARQHVKRLPVLGPDRVLRGIVSRKDLLSVYRRPDPELAAEVRDEVLRRAMSVPHSAVSVAVDQGVVTLSGTVERGSMIEIIRVLTAAVDGVVDVVTDLTAEVDETRPETTMENTGPDGTLTRNP
ncbi:CBS domain-containing protein [Nocardia otitidiscaviarum]|uniref:CBS domain-containing protein n=1 Tax=Nocardia otitidiscaviarum TaxID=1823 RepID=A0A516NLN4_9NOCA|nr:CBS domain-containing protein [Nocardia otitidiscaviarum]MCP9618759.1 CBS domain-containing protein [Nocardia otitidiscaviarum]QDP79821.1 CBS domain-containing protein [Nocardia otitidiscaviarum]